MSRLTPMMRQFKTIKKEYADAILFFRVGDFYEMFFDDAIVASRELEITLTTRDGKKKNAVPLAGFPYHAAQNYITKLLAKGYKVAICEQVEDVKQGKTLVKREVTRVITPGTKIEDSLLEEDRNNYLASLYSLENECGLTFIDISTGDLQVHSYHFKSLENIFDEIYRLQPSEIIVNDLEGQEGDPPREALAIFQKLKEDQQAFLVNKVDSFHHDEEPLFILKNQFPPDILHNSGIMEARAAFCSTATALQYVKKMQRGSLKHIRHIKLYKQRESLLLDAVTMRNLEIMETLRTRKKKNSLLGILDRTKTAMGGRMLRKWLERPLLETETLKLRWETVGELRGDLILKEELAEILKETYDLERLSGRINLGAVNPRDILALIRTLGLLPALLNLLQRTRSKQLHILKKKIPDFTGLLAELKTAIREDAPLTLKEGNIFKEGYNAQIDELRTMARSSKKWLLEFEKKERERTGIKSLKIGYNKVFGYYIEVTRVNLELVPADYMRKQTLVNAERFITEDLKEKEAIILNAEDELAKLEYQLFEELRLKLMQYTEQFLTVGQALANLDCFFALADVASAHGYTAPLLTAANTLNIKGARHPVIEQTQLDPYVPNDLFLDENQRVLLLTGPNMAGKSTYCRSIALLLVMAQIGSFVPAEKMEFFPFESIFARVGASDDLSSGRSTFMVEMEETATILKHASPQSLVILDEIGRGTSTYDGMSLAHAILEYLHDELKARVLFSTHYHELTALEKILPGIKNYTVSVREKGAGVIFLRKVVPGKADKSYGINVAKLAGLPGPVLTRAQQVLTGIEAAKTPLKIGSADDVEGISITGGAGAAEGQLSFFKAEGEQGRHPAKSEKNESGETWVIQEIRGLNIMNLTPLKALNKLYALQKKLLAEKNTYSLEKEGFQNVD